MAAKTHAEMLAEMQEKFPNLELTHGRFNGPSSRVTVRCTKNKHTGNITSFNYKEYVAGSRTPCVDCVNEPVVQAKLEETKEQFDAYKAKYPGLDFSKSVILHLSKRTTEVHCRIHDKNLTMSYVHNVLADKSICAGCKCMCDAQKWLDDNPDKVTTYKETYPHIKLDDVVFPSKTATTTVHCDECDTSNDDFTLQKVIRCRHGCLTCSVKKSAKVRTKTTEQFIEDAMAVHGDVYDYSKTDYKSAHEKVVIGCSTHGDFEQTPSSHVNTKTGCPKCGDDTVAEKNSMTTEDFIARAKEVHGDEFNYDEVEYGKNCRDKVILTCSFGHRIEQAPEDHLSGRGCIECSGVRQYTTEEFIEMARGVHGNKYDYSLVEYTNNDKPVKIICSRHGTFKQAYKHHVLQKGNCPVCMASIPERRIYHTFQKWGIKFKFQKKFNDCMDKRILRFDFFIPIPNKPGLVVEYDGKQHFEPVELWGGLEGLKNIQRRDGIKNDYCFENDIAIVRIGYDADLRKEVMEIKEICQGEGLL